MASPFDTAELPPEVGDTGSDQAAAAAANLQPPAPPAAPPPPIQVGPVANPEGNPYSPGIPGMTVQYPPQTLDNSPAPPGQISPDTLRGIPRSTADNLLYTKQISPELHRTIAAAHDAGNAQQQSDVSALQQKTAAGQRLDLARSQQQSDVSALQQRLDNNQDIGGLTARRDKVVNEMTSDALLQLQKTQQENNAARDAEIKAYSQQIDAHMQKVREQLRQGVDPDDYYKKRGTAGNIWDAIMAGLGQFAAIRSGGKVRNSALDIINQSVAENIDAQKANLAQRRGIISDEGLSLQQRHAAAVEDQGSLAKTRSETYATALAQAQAVGDRLSDPIKKAQLQDNVIIPLQQQLQAAKTEVAQQTLANTVSAEQSASAAAAHKLARAERTEDRKADTASKIEVTGAEGAKDIDVKGSPSGADSSKPNPGKALTSMLDGLDALRDPKTGTLPGTGILDRTLSPSSRIDSALLSDKSQASLTQLRQIAVAFRRFTGGRSSVKDTDDVTRQLFGNGSPPAVEAGLRIVRKAIAANPSGAGAAAAPDDEEGSK